MRLQPKPVARAMPHERFVTGLNENLSRRNINGFGCDAGLCGLSTGFIRGSHYFVEVALLGGGFAEENRARDIGAVPAVCRAKIENQRISALHAIVQGTGMGQGCIAAGMQDDVEG